MKSPPYIVREILLVALNPASYAKITTPPLQRSATQPLPYITVQTVTSTEMDSHDGRSFLIECIIQVNCWHKIYDTAFLLREAVKDALIPFSGPVLDVMVQGGNHIVDRELYNSDIEAHQLITRISMWFEFSSSGQDFSPNLFSPIYV